MTDGGFVVSDSSPLIALDRIGILDELVAAGFRLSPRVREAVLMTAGEE